MSTPAPSPLRRAAAPSIAATVAAAGTLAVSSALTPSPVPGPPGDANGDGVVNFADITSVLANWPGGPAQAPVGSAADQFVRELSSGLVVCFNFSNERSTLVYMAVEAPVSWHGAEGIADRLGRRDAFKGVTVGAGFPAFGEPADAAGTEAER